MLEEEKSTDAFFIENKSKIRYPDLLEKPWFVRLIAEGKLTFDLFEKFTRENSVIFASSIICGLISDNKMTAQDALTLNLTGMERITHKPTLKALREGECTFSEAKNRALSNVFSENDPHYQASPNF